MNSEVSSLTNEARANSRAAASNADTGNTTEAFRSLVASVDALTDAIDRLNK